MPVSTHHPVKRSRFHVSLSKHRPSCPHCGAHSEAVTRRTTGGSRRGYTIYPTTHFVNCRTRLFGALVPAGAPFAPGEHTNDRRPS